MSFLNLNLRFETPAAYRAWLFSHPKPTWGVVGTTYHNTYIPNKAQWRGYSSMASMADTYAGKGWSTGPHLYLATGTAFDGIYVMCPPWQEAIHGVTCNKDHFGVENVDDWDVNHPTDAQKALFVEVTAINHAWAGIGPNLNAHRDCVARTCPGQYGYAIKGELQTRLAMMLHTADLPASTRPGALSPYTEFSPILSAPLGDQAGFVAALQQRCTGSPHYTRDAQAEIANAYWLICGAVGVDPWLAAAQMCHETGNLSSWFSARPRRNPAGISVTGETKPATFKPTTPDWQFDDAARLWRRGSAFPTWAQHAIPAHVGRLVAYAALPVNQTPMQAALAAYALQVRPLPTAYWGSAPTLSGLNQKWAVGNAYAAAIARVANNLRGPLS